MSIRILVTLTLGMALFGASTGCGGESKPSPEATSAAVNTDKPAEPKAAEPAPAPTPEPAQADVVATPDEQGLVHVTANDQMRFSANRINAKAGEKIRIELKNVGSLPKEAMGHNLVVLKADADVTAFGTKAMAAKATNYIPADAADQIVAHTKLLGPGETDVIEIASLTPGAYPFVCSFPGHLALMKGVLVVE